VDDSLDHARRALARDEYGEALVYLWNALDEVRASQDPGDADDLAKLAEKVAGRGDEAEQADAERLLAELDRAQGEPAAEEVGTFQTGDSPEGVTVEPEVTIEGDEPQSKTRGSGLWGLIGLGVFLFFLLRDLL